MCEMKKIASINALCHHSGWYAAQPGNLVPPVELRKAISSISSGQQSFLNGSEVRAF